MESVAGWKEFELEVMRDRADNVVIVCSIENLDPMGVHTGDSITVAPALTLTDRCYQDLRDMAIKVMRAIGVDTGGANIQFAVDPRTGRAVVIEMNPRVSRSSALASKATGFPIAKLAAHLAIGYTLDEIKNDITGTTPAAFEPASTTWWLSPPLRLRQVPKARAGARAADEVGGRGDGVGPFRGSAASDALARGGNRSRPHPRRAILGPAPRDPASRRRAPVRARVGPRQGGARRRSPRDRSIPGSLRDRRLLALGRNCRPPAGRFAQLLWPPTARVRGRRDRSPTGAGGAAG